MGKVSVNRVDKRRQNTKDEMVVNLPKFALDDVGVLFGDVSRETGLVVVHEVLVCYDDNRDLGLHRVGYSASS